MLWRACGILGVAFLLQSQAVLAEEILPGNPRETSLETSPEAASRLFLAQDLAQELGQENENNQRADEGRAEPSTAVLTRGSAPQPKGVLSMIRTLLTSWWTNPRTPRQAASGSKEEAKSPRPLWGSQDHGAENPPRVDGAVRLTPTGSVAEAYGNPVDGDLAVVFEAHVGGTKKERATNSVKGTVGAQMLFQPNALMNPKVEKGSANESRGRKIEEGVSGVRFLLATDQIYEINPSTGQTKTHGEVVGALHWSAADAGRFRSDPWRKVAFRLQPVASCESRGQVGRIGNTKAATTSAPPTQLMGKVQGDLRLDFLSPRLVASGNYQYWHGLSPSAPVWDLATFSWNYQFSARVWVGGAFTHGKYAPSVQKTQDFSLALGMEF